MFFYNLAQRKKRKNFQTRFSLNINEKSKKILYIKFGVDIILLVIRTQSDDKGFQIVTVVLKCFRFHPFCALFC